MYLVDFVIDEKEIRNLVADEQFPKLKECDEKGVIEIISFEHLEIYSE